jgi:hypothetical protein
VKIIEAPKFAIRTSILPHLGEDQRPCLRRRLPGRKQGQQPEDGVRRSRGHGMTTRKSV